MLKKIVIGLVPVLISFAIERLLKEINDRY